MQNEVAARFLILDGDERNVLRQAANHGFEADSLLMPMLPGFSGKNRTVWWFSVALLFNRTASKADKLLYWGTKRFFDTFLRESSKWDKNTPCMWSQWDRTIEKGVKRFNGSIGLFMPQKVAGEIGVLPDWLGNRFVLDFIKEKLALKSIPIAQKGRLWPEAREELTALKGSSRIALAMIVKNEERFLAGCIEQALPYIDDIVIVDTGSNDETVNIAKSYGATVLHHKWQDDFAKARNAYMEALPEGFVMSLDADEFLVPDSSILLRALAERRDQKIYCLNTFNYHSEEMSRFSEQANVRLYYKSADCRYVGSIHEQLSAVLPKESFPRSCVIHYGYLPSVLESKKKFDRNLNLLEEATKAQGTSFDWYNKGCSMLSCNKPEEALDAFTMYFEIESEENQKIRPSAFWNAAKAALAVRDFVKALKFSDIACQSKLSEAYYTRAQVHEAMGNTSLAVEDCIKASDSPDDDGIYKIYNQIDTSIRMWRASFAAAQFLENTGEFEKAEIQYKRAHNGDTGYLLSLLGLSRVLRKQKKHTEALRWAKKAVLSAKDVLDARVEYLDSLLALEKFDEALGFIDESTEESALFSGLYIQAAEHFHVLGKLKLCNLALLKYLNFNPENAEASIFYARCLIEDSEPESALESLDRDWPLSISSDVEQEILIVRGNAYYALCDYDNALVSYGDAFVLGDQNAEMLFKIALTMIKLNRIEDALFSLARLKAVNPDYPGSDKLFELVKLKAKLLK